MSFPHLDPDMGWWAALVAFLGGVSSAFLGAFKSGRRYQSVLDRLDTLDEKIDLIVEGVRKEAEGASALARRAHERLDKLTGT